jgi:cytohesin
MYAVDYAQPASLCLLLEQGANPNATDHSGKTPVFFARGPRAITLVTILVNGGACLAHTDNQGYSCLFYALVHGERRLSVFLEQSGATCGFPEAVLRGDTTLARSLPTIVNLDAALPNGETFLTQTVRQGDFALTALLLDRGANPNVANVQGLTPLDVAAMSSRGRIVRLLLDSGATPALIQFTDHSTLRQWAGLPD